ncbi:FAD dependent oxidoreductase [Aspergillus alliaceus]|uniref:FAD dependent oxidoreductase n=1 Tax=Petromyces alliaceus TaxID=209559 RepID=A0A5N7BYQ8_PETAA|nr:FAD dependent oxidoreductase [Aspergillus alliaceus]KAB8238744.1 FAD dependent oxidoreductase [Aspergillus alliaceus]KAE8386981.1 FAD dependent oxidoreductase [Aspergillus alliaceus]
MKPSQTWRAALAASIAAITSFTAAADICPKLEQEGISIEKRLTLSYHSILKDYWSTACGDLRPKCVATPKSALEMSQIVKELHSVDTLFAVKSGGHMPNNGFASIQDGLLISTKNLDNVIYNDNDQTAIIGPGLSWEDAQKGLDGTGRTLVGGRLGGVGVGGYILGGGLSFLSSQYGWAANNVVNFEVILANGTIVNANSKENTDLFAALKGGGSNFGIVTAYTLQTYPQNHKVWGGNYIFTSDKTPQVLEAVRDFTENYPDDKAAIIATAEHAALLNTWIIFLFYDGPEPPQGVFDRFKAIGPLDKTKTWDSYYDLLKHNDFFILKGQRYTIATETTPLPNNTVGAEVMQTYYDHWFNVTKTVLGVPNMIGSIAFQPMPKAITSKAKARGGDLYNFPTDQDYIILELDFSYAFSASDDKIDAANKNLFNGFDTIISRYIKEGVLPDVYRPLFLNDANYAQDFWGRLGSTEQARETRKKYDPELFFQKRTSGGFRLG